MRLPPRRTPSAPCGVLPEGWTLLFFLHLGEQHVAIALPQVLTTYISMEYEFPFTRAYKSGTIRNMHRMKPRNATGLKGVYFHDRKKPYYRVKIYNPTNGMFKTLGYFSDRIKAARAYDVAARKMYNGDPDVYLNNL